MNFYTVRSLHDDSKIESSGVDIMTMSSAFKIIDKKSELKTLDNVMGLPFIVLEKPYQFANTTELVFVEQSKKLTFCLAKEGTPFSIKNGETEYFCSVHEGKLLAFTDESKLAQKLQEVSVKAENVVEGKAINWLDNGRVGLSSGTLCATLFPNLKKHHRLASMNDEDGNFEINWPHDSDDFSRCLRFLQAVPEARERLDEMKKISPEWKNLVNKWDEIETLFKAEKHEEVYDVISQCVKIKKLKP